MGRRSAPIIHKAKKAHSTVSRRVSDFIAILDSDDDGPAAMSSFTEEHRQPTTTALCVSITIVGILPEGSLQLRCMTLVTASPLRMRQKILTPMAQRLATTSTLAPAVLHQHLHSIHHLVVVLPSHLQEGLTLTTSSIARSATSTSILAMQTTIWQIRI